MDNSKSHQVFKKEDDLVYLLDRAGRVVPNVQWSAEPKILSGIFVIGHVDFKDIIYTVIGTPIKESSCDRILSILNFWVVFTSDNQLYIGRLDARGLNYKLRVVTAVDAVGLLTYKGCTLKINGEWIVYNYDFGCLTEDPVAPRVVINAFEISDYIKKGFTPEYIEYLGKCNNTPVTLPHTLNQSQLWQEANDEFLNVLDKLAELSEKYSPPEIGRILGLLPCVVSAMVSYLKLKDITQRNDDTT